MVAYISFRSYSYLFWTFPITLGLDLFPYIFVKYFVATEISFFVVHSMCCPFLVILFKYLPNWFLDIEKSLFLSQYKCGICRWRKEQKKTKYAMFLMNFWYAKRVWQQIIKAIKKNSISCINSLGNITCFFVLLVLSASFVQIIHWTCTDFFLHCFVLLFV